MPITKASGNSVTAAAKGDLVVGNATNDSGILSVGSANQVLTVDSSTATGLKWATPAAGGMTLLSTTTLSGSSVSITSIDQTYTDLKIILRDYYASGSSSLSIRLNGSANITTYIYAVYDTNSGSSSNSGTGSYDIITPDMPTSSSPSGTCMSLDVFQYANTSFGKPYRFSGGHRGTFNGAYNGAGIFRSTSAISSITIRCDDTSRTFSGGSVLIYGVK
jgi:hypothetical protein